MELTQSFSGLEELDDGATQPLSRSRHGSRWDADAAGALGGGQCFRLWQNHSSTVPKMNTIPAGMPMMTGQGSEPEAGENMGAMGGLVSAEETRIPTGYEQRPQSEKT